MALPPKMPTSVRTTLTAMQAQKMVQIAVLSALYFFCPEQAGNHNGTADIAANGNCHENHSDGVGCTDCRKRGFTDELPGNDAVCNLINLLKGNTQQHGNGKHPEHFSAAAPG